MLVDLREIESGTELRGGRVCIVGGGAAGITLARRLAMNRVDVTVLESGGLELEPALQQQYGGEADAYEPLDRVRLRYLGGTTNHWAGQSVPLDPLDFEARSWVPDSGWPIAYEEYRRHLDAAQAICEIPAGPFEYGGVLRAPSLAPFVEFTDFEPVLFRYSSPPTRFGMRYRHDLESDTHIRCFLHATCLRLVVDGQGDRIAYAEVGSLDGRRARVSADYFVLAGGAIENSRLLLLSRRASGDAVGNDHDLVGRFFMEHPTVDLRDVVLSRDASTAYLRSPVFYASDDRMRRDFRLTASAQAADGVLNHSVLLSELPSPDAEPSVGERLVGVWDTVDAKPTAVARQGNRFQLRIRLEHAPYAESRVTLATARDGFGLPRAKLDYRFGELEQRTVTRVLERFMMALGAAGLGRIRTDPAQPLERCLERLGWQNHHLGGTRMHSSPSRGVVDADCRVHGTRNLYVGGASVFPTSGHANPTMNLIALTLRLGEHLAAVAA